MASWLVREKRATAMIAELLEKATRRLQTLGSRPPLLVMPQEQPTVRREIRETRWIEPVALRLAVGKQPATQMLRQALLAQPA